MIKLKGLMKEEKLNEASEVKLLDIPIASSKKVLAFAKILGGKHSQIFDGIHGYIVDIKVKPSKSDGGTPFYTYRFDDATMRKLLATGLRWVEADKDIVSIGF